MDRHESPSLFIAVNGLYGDTKELCHLSLCFFQFFSELLKFFTGHSESLVAEYSVVLKRVKENDHNLWLTVLLCGILCQVVFNK